MESYLLFDVWFVITDSLQNITDDAVRELSERCPRLHYVCLSNCPNLTDASLVTLAEHCPLLSVLECVACTHFTDTGFQALAKVSWSSWLNSLWFQRSRWYLDDTLSSLFQNCRLLEKMDLEECVLITDITLVHLAMGCPGLEKLVSGFEQP